MFGLKICQLIKLSSKGELHKPFPFSTTRGFSTLGVGYGRSDPVTIFLVVPLFRLGGVWSIG